MRVMMFLKSTELTAAFTPIFEASLMSAVMSAG
jgi:hypothetical protein